MDAISCFAYEGLSFPSLELIAVVSFDLAPVEVDVVNRNCLPSLVSRLAIIATAQVQIKVNTSSAPANLYNERQMAQSTMFYDDSGTNLY